MEPTNTDIIKAVGEQKDALVEHTLEDHSVAMAQQQVNETVTASLNSIHEWKDTVATKEDIKEVLEFMKKVNIGSNVLNFGWNNSSKIGGFLILLIGIGVLFKVGIAGAVAWILGR